jgi:predicted transcriptional regulator
MIAKLILTTTPEPVRPSDSGSDILYHLDENRLDDIPVVDRGELIGSVRESDIYTFNDPDKPLSSQKVSLVRAFVYEYQHILDIIKVMTEAELSVLPVVDDHEHYTGCIVLKTVVEEMARMLSVSNPGAFIILDINWNDYILSQIAQIVESQDAKILNLFVTPSRDSTKTDVIIKVNTMEIQALMQTLNRYNYIIKATYTEDEQMYEDLRDRYDSLMRYLSI